MTLNEIYILETGNETFADNCEQIADDYAIEFVEWFSMNYLKYHDYGMKYTTQELLEIFKKEKGL
jgi:hypothetical protein